MDTMKSFKGYGKVDEIEQQAFQKKTRKRIIIIIISAVILLAVIIAAVAGILIHKRNTSSSSSSDSQPKTQLTPATSLKAVCDATQYPNSCFAAISSLPDSNTTDPEQLFKLSLKVAIDELSNLTRGFSENLSKASNDTRLKKAIEVCGSVLNDSLDRLNDSMSTIVSGEKILSPTKIRDVETWISAALTDHDTCLDAVGELNSTAAKTLRNEIETAMRNSTEFASNSLAIVTKVIRLLSNFEVPSHNRRLLGDFPEWLGAAERKLLAAEGNGTTVTADTPDAIVAKDGSGQYKTIGDALKTVPKKSEKRFVVYVKKGEYVENIDLDKNTWNVMIYGDGMTETVVSGSRNFMDGTPTFETATFAVKGKGFIAKDIQFKNTAGASKHQAVAFRSGSDQSVFYRCSFVGFQDTLYAHSNRQFYRDCDITDMAQTSNAGQMSVDTTAVFTTNEKFNTRDDVITWARDVGNANKVSIIITRSDTKNGTRGRNDKLILGCDRGGKYDSSQSSTSTASKKCNCPFKIRATPSTDDSGWKVQVKCGVHNHGLPDQYTGHPRKARLTAVENKRVEDLTKRHVAPRHIVLDLKEQNPDSVVTAKQIYRKRNMIQKEERGPRTEMQHVLQWLDDKKYVTWNRRRDDGSDVLSDIFWAHPDSIKLLNLFPIVLEMDCTYKTNKYRQPLLEIIGITSTNLTFAVGFAYLEAEKTDNYRWALEKLKGLFIKQDNVPQVILTDRELALINAIEIVFPHSVNLLCTWHINKNVSGRCGVHVSKDMRETVKNLWQNIVYSSDEVEYQQRLNELEQACVNSKKFFDYVNNIWLTPHKEKFVAAWTNKVMHLGNTTTNRVESAHWKLKQMLEHSKGDLFSCLKGMDDNMTLQVVNIKESFQKSFYYTEKLHGSPFFQNLRSFVSRAAMNLISDEFQRVAIVGTDKDICGCTLRSTCELPCACELGGYKVSGVSIPLDSVHGHWKKLTMEEPLEDDTEDGYELDMTHAIDAIWSRFRSLDTIGKRALKSKVFELAYPTTSSLCPPPEKIKTRGGVKNKDKGKAPKGYDVYRDPSYFEHVEREERESQGASKRVCTQQSESSQKQPSQKQPSQKQLSQTYKKQTSQQYLAQFPMHIHPHIIDIIEIMGDGNCGFRAIASLLGYTEDGWPMVRRELDIELKSNNSLYEKLFGERIQVVRDSLQISGLGDQLKDKWFTIPAMGYLVANRYNVILVTLGKPSTTFFPMTTSYSSSARFFCIGYVGGNHWVQVNMKQGFPLPAVRPEWKKNCSPEAESWISKLNGRLQYWQLLNPSVKPPDDVIDV